MVVVKELSAKMMEPAVRMAVKVTPSPLITMALASPAGSMLPSDGVSEDGGISKPRTSSTKLVPTYTPCVPADIV